MQGLARRTLVIAACVLLLFGCLTAASAAEHAETADDSLPQDSGVAGLKQELLRLRTTARLLHTTAHPDDEDGGMLVLESRGHGATAELLTLTRGEGGQNRMGSNFFDELGALRTLELLASDRYYGVSQRFSHAADFGFSKTAEETFKNWGGHDPVLSDMVLVIRTFRPDVIVSRFQGTARDGHGHHQASGILTKEAFRAAADPQRFPEQIAAGLSPWQAKKLYVDNVAQGQPYNVVLDTETKDPLLGMSYQQFAMQGLRHQLSQGAATWTPRAGRHYYKLVDTVLPIAPDRRERDFFDGIDTSLVALAARLGNEQAKAPKLHPELSGIADCIRQADAALNEGPASTLAPLLKGYELLQNAMDELQTARLNPASKQDVLVNLGTKAKQFRRAIQLASGVRFDATLDDGKDLNLVSTVSPGDTFSFSVRVLLPRASGAAVSGIAPVLPPGWTYKLQSPQKTEEVPSMQATVVTSKFLVTVPIKAEYTQPFYHRESPNDAIYTIAHTEYATLPVVPAPMHVNVTVAFRQGTVAFRQVVEAKVPLVAENAQSRASAISDRGKELGGAETFRKRPVAVVPAATVQIDPATQLIPESRRKPVSFAVIVRSNIARIHGGVLKVHAPSGWKIEPAKQQVNLVGKGSARRYDFKLIRVDAKPAQYKLHAALSYKGQEYDQGVSVVTREDLGAIYQYRPADNEITLVNVDAPTNLQVGYVTGAGDDIPVALNQLGMNVNMISSEELATGNLNRYGTIITGIRAYDVRIDLRKYNGRLLDFVQNGGTLVVQYNSSVSDFNNGHYTPYAAELSRDRVTDEHASVDILDPASDVFRVPNRITEGDFNGWIQERGLYFMRSWDSRWEPLLSMSDPGEVPTRGSLLRCSYGRGTYIYTGLSFFRQLPSGVPGAIRLFVNLVDAGHKQ